MASHSTLSPQETADRLAIRELFDAYAHCADTRDAEGQMALFTSDTRFSVFMNGPGTEPTSVLNGRGALGPVFEDLNRYEQTMHFNGQSTVNIEGDEASGDSYTIAHHVYTEKGTRMMMVAWLRYLDRFAKVDQAWYIADRQIILKWSEVRPLGEPTAG
jgi:SnoaL-like domain